MNLNSSCSQDYLDIKHAYSDDGRPSLSSVCNSDQTKRSLCYLEYVHNDSALC